jgi:hypothetical protein
MKTIRDIEQMYDLLKQCQSIFKRLNGDSIVMLREMESVNIQIQKLIGDNDSDETN